MNRDVMAGTFRFLTGWRPAILLMLIFILNELHPLVAGAGEQARWDWSFAYVTCRWLLIPLGGILHIATTLYAFFHGPKNTSAAKSLASILLSGNVVAFQWGYSYTLWEFLGLITNPPAHPAIHP